MEYSVQFVIDTPENEAKYRQNRDKKLMEHGVPVSDTEISGIPFDGDPCKESVVFRHGLGRGGFGLVLEGFDTRTGDLRAVKEMEVRRAGDGLHNKREVEANMMLSNHEGLVQSFGWGNGHGARSVKSRTYPLKIYLILEKGKAFNSRICGHQPLKIGSHDASYSKISSKDWSLSTIFGGCTGILHHRTSS